MEDSDRPSPDASQPEPEEGLSLGQLGQAFARAMGKTAAEPTEADSSPELDPVDPSEATIPLDDAATDDPPGTSEPMPPDWDQPPPEPDDSLDDDPSELCPRSILEAMCFVGNAQNEPLAATRAAALMRGVESEEIPRLVEQLNARYDRDGVPYKIVLEGAGYRMRLRSSFDSIRNRFHGRIRQARLSQAAIDLLAIVAYRQPIPAEKINRIRGQSSSHILSQLVRRRLLEIERPESSRRKTVYRTTDRFLELFSLDSIEDLPRAQELDGE